MIDLPRINRSLRRVAPFRRIGMPLYEAYRRLTASGAAAAIAINSVPKAGTHLVASIISRVPGIRPSGVMVVHDFFPLGKLNSEGIMPQYDLHALRRRLNSVKPGTFANCHLYYDEATSKLLRESVQSVFIVRDPRDVLLSQLHYIQEFSAHERHAHLMGSYGSREARLSALITGWPETPNTRGMADVGARLRAYHGWKESLQTFKFEEFAAPSSEDDLMNSLSRLAHATGLDQLADPDRLKAGIGDKWSPTMRAGRVRGWRDGFTTRQVEMVVELAGDSFTEWGYSAD